MAHQTNATEPIIRIPLPASPSITIDGQPELTGLEIMARIADLRRPGVLVYLDDEGRLVTEDSTPIKRGI